MQEAAEWLAALDAGRADLRAFEQWRAADPAHAVAFIRVNQTWRQLDRLGRGAGDAAPPVDAEQPSAPEPDDRAAAAPSRRTALRAAAAAGVAMAAGGGVFLAGQARAHVVETGIGERRRLYVGKGVCLDLNTRSRLRWWEGAEGLQLELEQGQVSLDLPAAGPACTVRAGAAEFNLAAGSFDMRLLPDQAVTMVAIKGEALLVPRRGDQRVRVAKAEELTVAQDHVGQPTMLSDPALRALSAWRSGELILDGQSLGEAVGEYNRYLRTPLVLEDKGLDRLRLGGRFLTDNPSEFVKALQVNFGVRARTENDRILLYRAPNA